MDGNFNYEQQVTVFTALLIDNITLITILVSRIVQILLI